MDSYLKILMLEDLPEDAGLIERALRKERIDFVSKRVDTKEEFIEALEEFQPDVILSDHSLPQFNSYEALKICKAQCITVPFILVTGTVSEEFAVNCLKEGADDYILKSNLTRLPSAISNSLKQRAIEVERKKAEEALMDQNIKLRKINQELDRFVYSASHDLRAPLKSVLGLVRLAKMDNNEKNYESLDSYFDMMEQSIFKLDATIKEIINYSKNTRTEILKQEIDFKEIIDDVVSSLQYMEGADFVDIKTIISEDLPFYSDPERLKVIFLNILGNSIKYRDVRKEQSFVCFKISVSREKASILIEDNGMGISSEYISRVFEMFYRATEKSDGSGLGLYIVKETMDKLNGTINLKSQIKVGTKIHMEIPNLAD